MKNAKKLLSELTKVAFIATTTAITYILLGLFNQLNTWYTVLLIAGIPAIISPLLTALSKRFKDFYCVIPTGITLVSIQMLEPTMPFRFLGLSIIMLVATNFTINIIEFEEDFIVTLKRLYPISLPMTLVVSAGAGALIALFFENSIIVIITLLLSYLYLIRYTSAKRAKKNNAKTIKTSK